MKQLSLLVLLYLTPTFLNAQNTGIGVLPFRSYTQGGFDTINNQNLNVMFAIPIVSSAGRGEPLAFNLSYNSQIYTISGTLIYPATNFGWLWDAPPGGSSGFYTDSYQEKCNKPGYPLWTTNTDYSEYYFQDALGTTHNFPISRSYVGCGSTWSGNTSAQASDHSGYSMTWQGLVLGPGGQQLGSYSNAEDANGNYISKATVTCTGTPPCAEVDWTDSVGNKAVKIVYSPNNTSPTQIQYDFLDQTGSYQTITLKLQSLSIATNFACSNGVPEFTGSATVPQELDIPSPNGSGTILKYLFDYETTPLGYSGRLKKITLPTNGFYEYDYPGPNGGINCSDGTALSMNRTVDDHNNNSAIWNFVRNTTNKTTTVTTPKLADTANANNTVYTFNSAGQEVTRQIYADTGTTLWRTINTTWASNGTPATQITILEDSNHTQSEVATTYDSNGLLDSLMEYDFGSGTHGSAIRTTNYTYATSSAYTSRNIINLVTSKQIKDSSGAVQYRQDVAYDGAALSCPTGAVQHDEAGYPCTMTTRGDPTSVTTYLSPGTPSGGITKNFTYDWFGNLLTAQLNCCTQKTWAYSSATQFSQPDSVTSGTSPTQLITNFTYNLYLGLVTKSTDPNNLVTNYAYDFLRRPTSISQANGSVSGQSVSYSYNDTTFLTTVKTTIDSSKSIQQISSIDGLGRVLVSTTEDVNNNVISKVSVNYDLIGRAYKTSNPYTSSPSYWTTTALDVLGRPTSVTLPDNSGTSYVYAEQYTTVTDPAGKQRKSQTDGAGRLIALTEPDTNNNLNSTTYYSYTVLDGLATVQDSPSNPTQKRTYAYDALGRLFTATTPEGGTTCFGTSSGGSCQANTGYDNFDNLLYRTDARGVVSNYTYDGLNRLKSVVYTVVTGVPSTATVSFTYGTSAAQFNNGALITMTDGVGSENYAYNALEQLTQLQKVISGTSYTTSYAYNIAGELTQITYPSLRVIQQSVDAVGRLCEIAPSTTACGTAASPYATGYGYNVASQVTGFKYGNGIYASLGFSSDRLQLNCLDYSTTNRGATCTHDSTTKFGLNYSYGSTGSNNGLIAGITDSVDNGRSIAYTYDPLSRLASAITTGSANYQAWNFSWSYDRYGNRLNQTRNSGPGYPGSVAVNAASNRITCIDGTGQSCTGGAVPSYDANGNMTYDGTNTMVYDAENRIVSATNQSNAAAYVYDGNGMRVEKCVPNSNCTNPPPSTVYIFSGSKVIAEYDNGAAVGSPSREYIYGGALLAKIDSSGTKYYHQDQLSNRLVTDSSGSTAEQMGTYPFGDPWYATTTDKLYFTTYERDSESNNDYAQARFFRWLIGRFLSIDPLSGSTSDPQSLNRYTYVENNPINFIDPAGMDIVLAMGDGGSSSDLGGYEWSDIGGTMYAGQTGLFGTLLNFLGSLFRGGGNGGGGGGGGGGEDLWMISATLGDYASPDPFNATSAGFGQGPIVGGGNGRGNTSGAAANPSKGPCADIKGKGGQLSKGSDTYTFDSNGSLIGYSTILNPNYVLGGTNYTVPANTRVGIGLTGENAVTIATSTPPGAMQVRLGGFVGAFVTSATFSGNSYSQVNGAVAVAGQAFGNPFTPSAAVKNGFNQNAQLLDFGSIALNALKIAHMLVTCESVFGGG